MSIEPEQTPPEPPESDPPIAAAGGVVYRWAGERRIEILLIKKQGGFWTLPKGRIKPDEAAQAAVAREVAEETNISGTVEDLVREVTYSIQKAGRQRIKTVLYFLLRAESNRPRPQAKERIIRARWFPIGAALRRIRRKRIRNVVRAARSLLLHEPPQADQLPDSPPHEPDTNQAEP